MNNKQGKSDSLGFIATALIVIAVILFRVYRAVGPESFGIGSIAKYLGEMAIVVVAYLCCGAAGRKLKHPLSIIAILFIIAMAAFLIWKVWRI